MKPPDDPEVAEWLGRSGEDVRVAEILMAQPDPLLDPICFHCQQAAEKLIKAVLIASGLNPPKTHDLEQLCSLLPDKLAAPQDAVDAGAFLTPFAVMPRYPVAVGLRAPDRADRAWAALGTVRTWAGQILGLGPVPQRPAPPCAGGQVP